VSKWLDSGEHTKQDHAPPAICLEITLRTLNNGQAPPKVGAGSREKKIKRKGVGLKERTYYIQKRACGVWCEIWELSPQNIDLMRKTKCVNA